MTCIYTEYLNIHKHLSFLSFDSKYVAFIVWKKNRKSYKFRSTWGWVNDGITKKEKRQLWFCEKIQKNIVTQYLLHKCLCVYTTSRRSGNTFWTSGINSTLFICLIPQFLCITTTYFSSCQTHVWKQQYWEGYRSVGAGFNTMDRTIEKDLKTNLTLREREALTWCRQTVKTHFSARL